MILSQIAACSTNRVIGKENKLPWHIPEDLKFFKNKTKNKILIMGRKTFESLGSPLPNRMHIVISRNKALASNKSIPTNSLVEYVPNFAEASELAQKLLTHDSHVWGDEVFISGGAEIYKISLPYTDRIYLTLIYQDFEGDTYFPEIDLSLFKLVHEDKREGEPAYTFFTYEKITR